jgi:hypothetical protein
MTVMAKYIPPSQSKASQIFDVIVLLVLAIGSLYIPLWLKLAGSSTVTTPQANPTWESLGQNPTMVDKWHQLGFADPASAASIITTRFDYSFNIVELLVMVVVLVGYFTLMLKLSGKEYRDVIAERFGQE